MPQTSKKTLLTTISNFKYLSNGSLSNAINFWRANSNQIKSFIEKKQFNKSDFDLISEKFSNLTFVYRYKEKYLDKNNTKNDEEIEFIFLDICKSYIALQIQFNVQFDKTLEYFDKNSEYYKKLRALLLIRFFKGSTEDYKAIFTEISDLLYNVSESNFSSIDDCCNLVIEYLNIVYGESDQNPFFNSTISQEVISFLYNYGNHNLIDLLKENEIFKKWFCIKFSKDYRCRSIEGINEIIDEIFSSNHVDDENKKRILKEINPILSEYKGKVNSAYKKYETYTKDYMNFLAKYKGISENELSKLDIFTIDINNDYNEIYNKYFGDYKDWNLIELCKYDIERIEQGQYDSILWRAFDSNKFILGCIDKLSEQQIKSLSKKLNNDSVKIKNLIEENFEKEVGEKIKIKPCEFKVCNLEDDLIDITLTKFLGESAESEYIELNGCLYDKDGNSKLAYIDEIVFKILSAIGNIKGHKRNEKSSVMYNEKNDELYQEIVEYKKIIREQIEQIKKLNSTISNLTEILKENKIVVINESNKNLIERRKKYKITVVGGRDNINNGYNNICRNKEFLKKLNYDFHLSIEQFKLKGNYDMQKNRKFADGIKTSLDADPNRIIIILQSDHETELTKLMKNKIYASRITYFGELDEKGNISKINQDFGKEKFATYIKKALDKFETANTNSSIALG